MKVQKLLLILIIIVELSASCRHNKNHDWQGFKLNEDFKIDNYQESGGGYFSDNVIFLQYENPDSFLILIVEAEENVVIDYIEIVREPNCYVWFESCGILQEPIDRTIFAYIHLKNDQTMVKQAWKFNIDKQKVQELDPSSIVCKND